MYKVAFQQVRWSFAAAAAMTILVIMTIIASYALRPLQAPRMKPKARAVRWRDGVSTMSKPKTWQSALRYDSGCSSLPW